ncbi:heme-binding beta-barrel domain-containing protein [Nannocystaceae bacterium ST9]
MSADDLANLGPLAPLAGLWEGGSGLDLAPADEDRREVATSKFRERMSFEPIGLLVDNHEQNLYGLRYSTMAWRIDEVAPFHQELGYWMWDAAAKQVIRCFVIPRGVSLIAGGTVEPDARGFELSAVLGSPTYGICSNPYLDREFKTLRFTMKLTLLGPDEFSYEEDTVLEIPGQPIFHHTDANRMRRIA